MKKNLLLVLITIFFSCKITRDFPINTQNKSFSKKLTKEDKKNWQHGDIINDSIVGLSLSKTYNELISNQKSIEVIIAVIDNPIDIEHNYLKSSIWINTDEVPNNGIDDDDNGYIDDINGWNFLGNSKGENYTYSSMEITRIVNKYDSNFRGKQVHEISDKQNYKLYHKARKSYDSVLKYSIKKNEYYTMVYGAYYGAKQKLSKYFSDKHYSTTELDSLKLIYPEDSLLNKNISKVSNFQKFIGKEKIDRNYLKYRTYIDYYLNKEFNDRNVTGDNPNDITDTKYGNNIVNHNLDILNHGTLVSGSMVASQDVTNEVKGVIKNAKIMPLSISCYGDEHDKDIALAIRYAVDNGAKVINMSFGKRFSLHKEWVFEAFQYAEKHNVLIVSSAGNSSLDLSVVNNYYPNDNENNEAEVSNNFLLVGASTYKADEKLVASFSNYGKTDVDIFAPGYFIYTTAVNNEYEFQNGTSMAASITSGVAALIFSYYPNLSASEVKQIIMESGVSYDIMVNKPSGSKEKEKVPFSTLSKSGKIVNAYNALLMAEEVSKKKKKK